MPKKYNNYQNFETWLVSHEYFNGFQADGIVTAEELETDLRSALKASIHPCSIFHKLASSSISRIDFHELAELYNDEYRSRQENICP